MTTPSTPIADVVDALAADIKAEYYIKFGELAGYLEACGISVGGDEALTGLNLRNLLGRGLIRTAGVWALAPQTA